MRKLKLFSLLAALTCATTMWAASGTWTNDNCTATLTEDGTMTFSGTGAIERKDGVGWDSYLDDLKSLIIEDGLTSIVSRYPGAFHSSLILNSLDLGNGMQSIGNNAFNNCRALISVTIPASVTYIGNDVFYECKGITDVYCYPDAADLTWEEADKDDFKKDAETLCHVKASQLSAYISKFSSSVNVTFVGDLPEGGSSSTPAVNGKLTGEFSINSTGGKVNFSSGNLQYLASTDTWRFGENQYDYIGAAPGNNVYTGRATQAQWIDLFCWGTGTNPTYISYNGADFLPGITGEEYEFGTANDWGTAAAEDLGDGWRTLNKAEWLYILEGRDNAANLWTKATVDGKAGLLLLPDGWTADGVTLTITGTSGAFTTNELDLDEWNTLQNQGAVFLPAAGANIVGEEMYAGQAEEEYKNVIQSGTFGYYWLATAADDDAMYGNKRANVTIFYDSHIYSYSWRDRSMGSSVRLVQDVQAPNTRDDVSGIEDAMADLIGTGATDLTIVRDLYKDGFFNTLCLPFSLNASELDASPLAGCQLYSLSDASYDGDNLYLTIAEESSIVAGMPYLIKWNYGENITSMTFNDVTVTASTGSTVTEGGVRFVGTIGRSTLPHGVADYLFLGANDNLYYSDGADDTSMKGFRAYFIVNSEASTDIPRHAPARLVIAPKMPTAVDNVQGDNVQSTKVIENGQLFIIKNGVKYNAQGQMVK